MSQIVSGAWGERGRWGWLATGVEGRLSTASWFPGKGRIRLPEEVRSRMRDNWLPQRERRSHDEGKRAGGLSPKEGKATS